MGGAPVVDLPVASQCEHDHVVYHYVDEEGKPQAVALTKAARCIRFSAWEPVHMYWVGAGHRRNPLSLAEKERYGDEAALLAYQELNSNRYEQGYPLRNVAVFVRISTRSFYVEMGLVEHRHVEPVWVDGTGKVWY